MGGTGTLCPPSPQFRIRFFSLHSPTPVFQWNAALDFITGGVCVSVRTRVCLCVSMLARWSRQPHTGEKKKKKLNLRCVTGICCNVCSRLRALARVHVGALSACRGKCVCICEYFTHMERRCLHRRQSPYTAATRLCFGVRLLQTVERGPWPHVWTWSLRM